MCGIAGGVWTKPELALDEATLTRMLNALEHRGPDDSGIWFSSRENGSRAALGHRRLSIIDLGGGHQPLCNEDGTIWIAFNGEIYNFQELRESLITKGHRFKTETDTEVIIHLYEEYGVDCIEHLRGMFAFSLWDENRQRLLLARDRIGQKPLFYRHDSEQLLFASELKAILEVPGIQRKVDPEAIDLFLTYQYVPHPRSILSGFSKLPPGHRAIWENGSLTVESYWSPAYAEGSKFTSADEGSRDVPSNSWTKQQWQQRLREVLTEAVRLRMRSDVPIGAFLSGGVDSTIIAGLMQSLSDVPIHTFSIGFPVKEFDEREFAREAAKHLGTNHHEYVVEPSALETLPKLIWHYDEPFGDSSAIPTMYLSDVTRKLVTVSLSGDGGDELFCGYNRYHAVALAGRTDWLPPFVRSIFGWKLWQQIPTSTKQKSFGRRAKRFLGALGQSPEQRYLRWIGIFDSDLRQQIYTPAFRSTLAGYDSSEFIRDAYRLCPDRDFVTRTTCADVLSYLPCDILTKVDIASMAYSLEARSPFLDHHVAELAARMPIELKYEAGRGKQILIETFSDLIPKSIQTRKKMGFGVPIDHWFRNELRSLVEETLLTERCHDRGYFEPKELKRLVHDHLSGRWDHSYRLWNLICLEQWHRVFIDGL